MNSNSHLKIILSRDNDQTIPVKDRVIFARNNNADLFISIHVNAAADKQLNGFSVFIDKKKSDQDILLGSALISELKKSYKTENQIAVRKKYSIVVLDSSAYPTALIECGYLSNPTDAAFISSSADQDKIAQNILDAINAYASSVKNLTTTSTPSLENSSSASSDTIPSMYYKGKRIKNISVQSNSKNIKVTEPVIKVTYQDGSTEMISKEEADKRGFVLPPPPPPGLPPSYFKSNALFVVDGKISTSKKARELNPQDIQSIYVLKDEKATAKYGDKGKNGVIELVTKNKTGNTTSVETDTNIVKGIRDDALIIIDGKKASREKMEEIDPSSIESIIVLTNQDSLLKYGVSGKKGIIKVTTKKFALSSHADTIPNKIFTKVEITKLLFRVAHKPGQDLFRGQ